jgi:hypothetical protein
MASTAKAASSSLFAATEGVTAMHVERIECDCCGEVIKKNGYFSRFWKRRRILIEAFRLRDASERTAFDVCDTCLWKIFKLVRDANDRGRNGVG